MNSNIGENKQQFKNDILWVKWYKYLPPNAASIVKEGILEQEKYTQLFRFERVKDLV